MTGLLWTVLASLALSGFFALVGYSLREFRRGQLEEAFGPRHAPRVDRLEEQLTALRLTAAFCRSVANLVFVVAMLYSFEVYQHDWVRLAEAMAAAGAALAIFGQAIPHAWAHYCGEKVLARTSGVLLGLRYVLYPIIAVMQAFDLPIRRLSGAAEGKESDAAKQEILEAASEGRAEGSVNADEVRMIESVMEFGDRQACEIMTPRTDMVALSASTPWKEACRAIYAAGHTRIPVYEGDLDNIIGVIYAKDLLQHVNSGDSINLRALMRKPFFVPETKRLDSLLREFKARKVHVAIVLDEYGGTAGLVSFEDVLEEIVGDISDEYDRPEPALMKRIDEKSAEVDGRMYIDDLNEAMGLHIPEDADYDTVAGLVFSELGYIPASGETLDAYGAHFAVLSADERKINRIRVQLRPQEKAD